MSSADTPPPPGKTATGVQGHVSEDELHAFVDGRLSPQQRMELDARLARDPDADVTAGNWAAQRDALKRLHAPLLTEPVPASLLAAAGHLGGARAEIARWQRWGGIAAGVLLAFVLGWTSRSLWPVPGAQLAANGAQTRPVAAQQFVHQAALAHLVYAPEVRHPVEVTAAQQEHLVQWLSKRVGRPLKVPNLSAEGFELVGGRLLPGEDGARAQFMFQDGGGQRVTLYLGAVGGAAPVPPAGATASTKQPAQQEPAKPAQRSAETAFRLVKEPVPSFYWIDQGFGYALAGQVSNDTLLKLAEEVYRQL